MIVFVFVNANIFIFADYFLLCCRIYFIGSVISPTSLAPIYFRCMYFKPSELKSVEKLSSQHISIKCINIAEM